MPRQPTTDRQIVALKGLTQGAAAYIAGMPVRTFREAHPPRNPDGTYDARAIAEWWLQRQADQAAVSDPMLAGGPSPNLERWRKLRADREEIEIARLNSNLVDREVIRGQLGVLATFVRRAGEQLQRECGRDAHAILEEALRDFEGEVNGYFGSGGTAADDDQSEPG